MGCHLWVAQSQTQLSDFTFTHRGKSSEDNRRRWPSVSQGERPQNKSDPANIFSSVQFISVAQSCPALCVQLFVTPWAAACQSLCPSPTPGAYSDSCQSSQRCHPTISSSVSPSLLPSTIPSIRVLSNESVLRIRWPYLDLRLQLSRIVKKYIFVF